MPNQKPMWTRCLGGFSVMWVTKLLIFPVEIRIFCPKTTKFGPKLAFLVNLGQAMQAYSMPCCGSVGGCGAQAVYRKTPIYFIKLIASTTIFINRELITSKEEQLMYQHAWVTRIPTTETHLRLGSSPEIRSVWLIHIYTMCNMASNSVLAFGLHHT